MPPHAYDKLDAAVTQPQDEADHESEQYERAEWNYSVSVGLSALAECVAKFRQRELLTPLFG